MTYHSVTEVAEQIGCRPRDISDLFYQQLLDDRQVLKVAGRRAIPSTYVPEIRRVLAERGKLQEAGVR